MVRPGLKDVQIWSRTRESADRLAGETGARAVTIEDAAEADVVLTATASPEPVLMGRWLKPDAVVLAVGAVGSSLRELDDEVMRTSWVVAESRKSVEREAGDVVLSGARIEAEIGEILAEKGAVDLPAGRRILFKSVGMAIEDMVAARMVWNGRDQGSGTGDQ
jgi:thiomorpholine-carboxylate dehydrogenase